jgi:dihydroxyacetone kinase-like predicted kinase
VTIFSGHDVEPGTAEELRRRLSSELADVEVELVDGGQPHYQFVIAVE